MQAADLFLNHLKKEIIYILIFRLQRYSKEDELIKQESFSRLYHNSFLRPLVEEICNQSTADQKRYC